MNYKYSLKKAKNNLLDVVQTEIRFRLTRINGFTTVQLKLYKDEDWVEIKDNDKTKLESIMNNGLRLLNI